MEKIQVIGHVGRDAEIREVNGKKALNFSVAVNQTFIDNSGVKTQKTRWYNCTRWVNEGGSTEVAKYLTKGTMVYVEGTPDFGLFKDNQNQTQVDARIRIINIELLGSGKKENNTAGADKKEEPAAVSEMNAATTQAEGNSMAPNNDFLVQNQVDDLPF